MPIVKKRIEWLDILKGIGILFVIWGHGLVKNPVLYNIIWSVHMPLFIYASGYTYTKRPLYEQIRKDIKGLLFPYWGGGIALWIANMIFLFMRGEKFNFLNLTLDYIGKILYGSGGYLLELFDGKIVFSAIGALWFVPSLFCARIILNLILSIKVEYRLCTLAGIVYLGLKVTELLTVNKNVWLPFSVQASMSGVLFMFFGVIARKEKVIGWGITAREGFKYILCGLVWFFTIYNGSGIGMVFNNFPNGVLDFIGALCGLVCLSQTAVFIDRHFKYLGKMLTFCGRNTMVFLIFHLIELDFIDWYKFLSLFGINVQQTNIILILVIKIIWCAIFVYISKYIKEHTLYKKDHYED